MYSPEINIFFSSTFWNIGDWSETRTNALEEIGFNKDNFSKCDVCAKWNTLRLIHSPFIAQTLLDKTSKRFEMNAVLSKLLQAKYEA